MTMKPSYEELERRVQELQESEIYYRTLLESVNDAVLVHEIGFDGMPGKFIGPSHSILGYDQDSLVGRNVMELVHSDDYQEVATAFAEFLANREDGRKVEYRYLRADGNYIWFETVGKFILNDAGNPKEILFTSRDFTARKRAEGELKRIEWMLSRKPVSDNDALTEPHDQGYGDLTELNRDGVILKSIGHERLKNFANDYLELLGTSSAIYEINGDYAFGIFASGWCRMMDSASRKLCNTLDNVKALNAGRWLCHESCWSDCAKKAIANRAEVEIECNGGIRMYAVPIFAGGNVIGAINFGYGDPPKDPEKLTRLADVFNLKYDYLLCEATAYDSRPPYIIEMAKKRLSSTAKLIGSMVETNQATEALKESEELLETTGRMAQVGGWQLDVETMAVTWTKETYNIHEVPLNYKPPLDKAIDFFHPNDREALSQAIQLDLNDTVESMLNMLRRLIGEDIDLVWKPATHLWPVKMDPSQIDQILANLCVNARDAIDGVGKLTTD